MTTCSCRSSSSFIGRFATHSALALDPALRKRKRDEWSSSGAAASSGAADDPGTRTVEINVAPRRRSCRVSVAAIVARHDDSAVVQLVPAESVQAEK